MRTIQVDEEVFGLLQKNAKAFVDSPNSTLRKMLGLEGIRPIEAKEDAAGYEVDELPHQANYLGRSKAPKASLKLLVQAGLLRDGERLYLVDYQGNRVQKAEAVVAGALLEFGGRHQTMSSLASELLKKVGFQSDSVRGPSHWVNAENVSITDLWQRYSDEKAKKE